MSSLEAYWIEIKNYFMDGKHLTDLAGHLIKIIVIIVASRIIVKIADKTIDRIMAAKESSKLKIDARRATTIGKLIHNTISYTVNFIALLLILGQLGLNLGPLLAGAGVLGLAIGFGAQSLVKDVITGFFIIFEDQFAVGDVIQVGQFKGKVEQIGIRVTRVRSWTGEVHIIPNGTIGQVTNFSIYNSTAVVDIAIAYEADLDRAQEVLRQAVKGMQMETPLIVNEPVVQGVQAIANSEIVLRVTAECMPNQQGDATRIMYAKIKKELDANGIEIPYPKTVTYIKSERAEVPNGT